MNIIEGNEENFDSLVEKGDVLVDFFATWCGPCKMIAPELEGMSDKVQIVKVNIDENADLCKRYGVMSVPTLIYFDKDGNTNTNVGYMPKDAILNWIGK